MRLGKVGHQTANKLFQISAKIGLFTHEIPVRTNQQLSREINSNQG